MQLFNEVISSRHICAPDIFSTPVFKRLNKLKVTTVSVISAVLLIAALWHVLAAGMVYAKAELAQYLIAEAWTFARAHTYQTMNNSDAYAGAGHDGGLILARLDNDNARQFNVKPWPWADTWPVAKLEYSQGENAQSLFVLAGAQGNSLAFGPGHLDGSAMPGTPGVSVVGGHRDTHFYFLKDVSLGEKITITVRSGDVVSYTVTETSVHNSLTDTLLATPYASQLILVTCYPFDAIRAGGPMRYVVTAEMDTDVQSPLPIIRSM